MKRYMTKKRVDVDTYDMKDTTLPNMMALYTAQVMCLLSLKNAGALRTVKHR